MENITKKTFILLSVLFLLGGIILYNIYSIESKTNKVYREYRDLLGKYASLEYKYRILNKEYIDEIQRRKDLEKNIKRCEENVRECRNKINDWKSKYYYHISNNVLVYPRYEDLVNFIKRDKTNEITYNDSFVCTEFTNTFIRNFAKEGFFSCATEIVFEGKKAHMIVAVKTTDRGLVYVEPQDDKIIDPKELKIGADYCKVVNWFCENKTIRKVSSCFSLISKE